jgi:predicted RNase H-like nuclease (RuvC/YqgF family)
MSDFKVFQLSCADFVNSPVTEVLAKQAEMQLLRAQFRAKPSLVADYTSMSHQELLELVRTKDAELHSLKADCEFIKDKSEVQLSLARNKLVQLMDSMLVLDQEVAELKALNNALKLELTEKDKGCQAQKAQLAELHRESRLNQQILSEYEAENEALMAELSCKLENIEALERTIDEEIAFSSDLKEINRDQRAKIAELEELIESNQGLTECIGTSSDSA